VHCRQLSVLHDRASRGEGKDVPAVAVQSLMAHIAAKHSQSTKLNQVSTLNRISFRIYRTLLSIQNILRFL